MVKNMVYANASGVNNSIDEANKLIKIQDYVSEQYTTLSSREQKELVNEIYQEKYIRNMQEVSALSGKQDAFVDVAYQNMLERENYIVELVSEHSGLATSFDAWEYNLQYLIENYEEIIGLENVNKVNVDRYIEDYKAVQATRDMPVARVNEERMRTSSYSYMNAVVYAKRYYSSYNTAYPDWTEYGGDCANFISQCLYAGGKTMRGTPGTTSAAENWSNWFSTGTSCNTSNVSSTWRGANAFKGYWQSNASSYMTFSSICESSYDYGFMGDAVSLLNSNGSAYHTVMIIGYDEENYDFIVAAHTGNTMTKKLSEYNLANGFIIYNMR